ncbi:disease resistance protein At4g27190-like [Magnolia sinica]|uniref:disease resistance protein At4g27190-like n=1 Tax=Magnolia sinica TaxID=86752 RepID=UPI00265912FB|nr:disease resistance protein At4g27190-like [Magnolia sinica]
MKTDKDIRVEVLSDEEAWMLFCQNAGDMTDLDRVGDLARAVARECSGLSLAIITVGRAMRGKTRIELWKHALEELRSSVPDIRGIEKGLIDERQNFESASYRGIALIENLKDSCLLDKGAHERTVKMHDVVCDVAIWIASSLEDGSRFFIESGMGLNQLPEEELPPKGQLTELQTLDLSGTQISELPSEIGQLDKLKQLYLPRTLNLESIKASTVSRLSSLEVFDVSLSAYTWDVEQKADEGRSTIEELPSLRFLSVLYIRIHSIACLALDFSWLKRLRRFHLENLEEIKVRSCYNMRAIFEEKEEAEVTKLNGESLGKLRTIKVDDCELLTSLISYNLLHQLKNLEEIEVRNCSQMEEIITTKEVADGQASDIIREEGNAIPRLGILKLFSLKELIHVCKEALHWQHIEVSDCPMLQKDSQFVARPRFLEDLHRLSIPNGE